MASEDETSKVELVADALIRQEKWIVFYFLERSELCLNSEVYKAEYGKKFGLNGSLVDYIVQETEKSHAKAGRYKCPTEVPFFPEVLQEPILPQVGYAQVLHQYSPGINVNEAIWDLYFDKILPKLAKKGSDGNNGLCAVCDAKIVQALSRRVHYSMLFAEARFRKHPETYVAAIRAQDENKLRELLTREEIDGSKEEKVTSTFSTKGSQKIKAELASQLLEKYIVPLGVEVQVQYLMLKGVDDNFNSRGACELIRLKALSRRVRFLVILVRAGPSLLNFGAWVGVLMLALAYSVRDKITALMQMKGLMLDKKALTPLGLYVLSAKGAYEALQKGKEVVELVKYYAKLFEKDKKSHRNLGE